MKTAFVFPGQGAQKVGMGRDLYDNHSISKTVFEEADESLGEDFSKLIFEGPQDALTLTANTQPAIVTVSVAALRAFQEQSNFKPDFVAGHSLGEYSALVAAEAMEFSDAIKTTRARGTYMQEAVPAGEGAMAAVMKMERDDIDTICSTVSTEAAPVSPANYNCPGQIVISGASAAVKEASAQLKEKGGRVIPLKVSAPFHCKMMDPAAASLDAFLADKIIGTPVPPVVTNVEATPNGEAGRIRELLVRQVSSPVLWSDSVRYMISQGVDTFVEFGPGNVLAGLIGKIDKTVTVISVGNSDGVNKAKDLLAKK